MKQHNQKPTGKSSIVADIRLFFSALPPKYRFGILAVAWMNLAIGLLDSFGLALLIPFISLISGTDFDGESSNVVVDWGTRVFSSFGHEMTLVWIVVLVSGTQVLRSGGIFLQYWLSSSLKSQYEVEIKQRTFRELLQATAQEIIG